MAIFLVTLVILFFLRNFNSTLIPFLTVPLSLLSSFIFLNLFGFSINLITLLALVLCTGLVVDDSIVMLENIYKKIEDGEDSYQASISGAKEVFFAIISTSIVLISVFLPIIFMEGNTIKLFEELAITIIGAIFFSTIISLTLTPMLCSNILKKHNKKFHNNFIQKKYVNLVNVFISSKKIISSIFLSSILFSILLFFYTPKELSPKEDRGAFFLILNSPEGSSFKNTVNEKLGVNLELEIKIVGE